MQFPNAIAGLIPDKRACIHWSGHPPVGNHPEVILRSALEPRDPAEASAYRDDATTLKFTAGPDYRTFRYLSCRSPGDRREGVLVGFQGGGALLRTYRHRLSCDEYIAGSC